MDRIKEHLEMIFKISYDVQNHFVNKNQDEIIRFVFCGVQKISRISQTFMRLYSDISEYNELEFTLGILARSILMDMILVLKVKSICVNHSNENFEELKNDVSKFCYATISDGTNHIIEEIFSSTKLSESEKKVRSLKLAHRFPNAFDFSNDKPKLKKEYRYKLGEIGKESQHPRLITGESIINLYSFYSKYDHLSHWTSLTSTHTPFESRKGKIDLSIILMVMHLRDLLSIAHDFDSSYKILISEMEQLQNHLDSSYKKEFREAE